MYLWTMHYEGQLFWKNFQWSRCRLLDCVQTSRHIHGHFKHRMCNNSHIHLNHNMATESSHHWCSNTRFSRSEIQAARVGFNLDLQRLFCSPCSVGQDSPGADSATQHSAPEARDVRTASGQFAASKQELNKHITLQNDRGIPSTGRKSSLFS